MFKRLSIAISLFFLCMTLGFGAFAADNVFFTQAEEEAFAEAGNGHFIKARQLAEKILEKEPDSLGALYTMAYVFWDGEGNLTRAMQYLKRTRAKFESVYCTEADTPQTGQQQAFHQRILRDLASVYAELDQREKQLAVLQEIADLYHTPLTETAVWPLIKLGRFDEAESIARNTIASRDKFSVSQAYNDLTALEDAKHKHLSSFRASEISVEYAAGKSCVILINHARAYATLMNAPKSIEYLLKADEPHERDCVTDPMTAIAEVYLIDGMWQKAISAMLKVRKKHVEKRYIIQTEREQRKNIAQILHEMGFSERAWSLMKTVIDAPGRLGYDSLSQNQVDMAFATIFLAISQDAYQRADEKIQIAKSLEPFWIFKSEVRSQIKDLYIQRSNIERKNWSTHQKLFKQALDPSNLKSFLVPFYVLSPEFFYVVVDVLGRKTAEYLIDFQENSLEPEELQLMKPAYNITRGYLSWRSGELEKAIEYLDEFDKQPPVQMRLLNQQSKMIRAMILRAQGNVADSMRLLSEVYPVFPALFRHFDIALPITFDPSTQWDEEDFSDIMDILEDSNRFEITDQAPFMVSAQRIEHIIQICILSKTGNRYACSTTNPKDFNTDSDEAPPLFEVIDNFFHVAFSPKVDASQADINSLDGYAIQLSADEALKKLIDASPKLEEP